MNNQNLNLLMAILLSIGIMLGWQHFIERPKLAQKAAVTKEYHKTIQKTKTAQQQEAKIITLEEAFSNSDRIFFENELIQGSINLKGLRFDDLVFKKYKENLDSADNVRLLYPSSTARSYFVELGWSSTNKNIILPDDNTVWKCKSNDLGHGGAAIFVWSNPQNIEFKVEVSLDSKYMFNIKQEIVNNSNAIVSVQSYGLVNKSYNFEQNRMSVIHEGVVGMINDSLKEYTYKEMKDKKRLANNFDNVGWYGLTDKYWMVMFIPDQSEKYAANANYTIKNALERYQADFISPAHQIPVGSSYVLNHKIFAGAKELNILDSYEEKLNIRLFDRTIDFGWFYVITKPLLYILHFFCGIVGNFGVSIMIVTVLVKLLMFNLANKSYKSMKIMKELQPQIENLKARCGEDKMRLNQEVMALYKVKKVNPLSGCLPLFIQIPVFFSLYKVLNVSLEMRHAPFYGWVKDLSAADPTNIFNLFGYLSVDLPSFMHLGIWPILMAATMYGQQKMSPPPSDPAQAQVMKLMPLMFLFMFGNFPAGLLIYWTWNNILSILQQTYINRSNA